MQVSRSGPYRIVNFTPKEHEFSDCYYIKKKFLYIKMYFQ